MASDSPVGVAIPAPVRAVEHSTGFSFLRRAFRRLQVAGEPSSLQQAVRWLAALPCFYASRRLTRSIADGISAGPRNRGTAFGSQFDCVLTDLVSRYIYLFGIWEPDVTHFVRASLAPGDTFVDVGAHVGYYTLLASRLVGTEGAVVAIEPSDPSFRNLLQNVRINEHARNVRLERIAVSRVADRVLLYPGPDSNPGGSSLVQLNPAIEGVWTDTAARSDVLRARESWSQAQSNSGTWVRAAPLWDVLHEREAQSARLIKIDVEGFELEPLYQIFSRIDSFSDALEVVVEWSPRVLWPTEHLGLCDRVLNLASRSGFRPYVFPKVCNVRQPWRYLWPSTRSRPRRIDDRRLRQYPYPVDIVFSRAAVPLL